MKEYSRIRGLYEKLGFKFIVDSNEIGCLYFRGKDEGNIPDVLVKICEGDCNIKNCSRYIAELESRYPGCTQFKLIFLSKIPNHYMNLPLLNVTVTDITFVDELEQHVNNNMQYIELNEFNRRIVEEKYVELKKNKRADVVQATGTGKTSVCAKIISKLKGIRRILYLAPSKYILQQVELSYLRGFDVTYMTYSKFLRNYQSELESGYDLVCLDEFHRCGAKRWGIAIDEIVVSGKIPYILGLSATPIRYLDNRRDMSKELFDKEGESSLPVSKAIAHKILPLPVYYSGFYSTSDDILKMREKVENISNYGVKVVYERIIDDLESNCELRIMEGIAGFLREYNSLEYSKFIVFCRDKEHMESVIPVVSRWFKSAGRDMQVYSLYSGKKNCDDELRKFSLTKEDSLLFCIDILTEGISIDNLTGSIFLRKSTSPIIVLQQLGRCLRAGFKHRPLILDLANNINNVDEGRFESRIRHELRQVNESRQYMGLDGLEVEYKFIYDSKEIIAMFNSVEDKLNLSWTNRISELKKYYNKFGNSNVPVKSVEYFSLGGWCSKVRSAYANNLLSEEQVRDLEEFDFVWSIYDAQWLEGFELYKAEKDLETKSKRVVNFIRNNRKSFFKDSLSDERIALLRKEGFDFEKKKKKTVLDKDAVASLVMGYVKENNEFPKSNTVYEGVNIGAWIRNLKSRKLKNVEMVEKLSANEILKEFFDREISKSTNEIFEDNLKILKKSIEEKDYSIFPKEWVARQRTSLKAGKLSESCKKRLAPYEKYILNGMFF